MKKLYSLLYASIFLFSMSIMASINTFASNEVAHFDSTRTSLKFKDSRTNKPFYNPAYNLGFEAFLSKVARIKVNNDLKSTKSSLSLKAENQKQLDNVKVYPNPISTQVNLSYTLNKEYLVTIKILDVLGQEVLTLLNQKIPAGEQTNSFNLSTKLNSGLYFLRVTAGSESVIKRISVL